MLNLSLEEICYIAGIIDGEGYMTVGQQSSGHFILSLNVANTNKALIDWLSKKWEQKTSFIKNTTHRNWKDKYSITITGEKVKELLRLVVPYLIVKAEQASVALQFPMVGSGNKLGEEEELIQALCCVRMTKLNKRGRKEEEQILGTVLKKI